jgi:hypothetical protein
MSLRTQTRPNGRDGFRDVIWGWEAIGFVLALFSALAAGIVYNAKQFEAAARDRAATAQEVAIVKAWQEATAVELQRRVTEAAELHRSFVTHGEYDNHNHGGKVPAAGGNR